MSTDPMSTTSASAKGRSAKGKGKSKGKSKPGTYLAIGTTLFAAFSNIKKVRTARGEGDTLQLVDAAIRVAAVVTGVALLVRELRQGHDDILTD